MPELKEYYPASSFPNHESLKSEQYKEMYRESIERPDEFWSKQAEARLSWTQKWTSPKETSFDARVKIKWFEGGKLNAAENCLDRHLPQKAQEIAFFWEPDDPSETSRAITYAQLHDEVCRFSNALKSKGVTKGDRVTIYMPMIPEAIVAMLSCARIGAVHSVVFGGFSPQSIASRILDCQSEFVVTADEGLRGGKKIALKKNVDAALESCPNVKAVFVVERTGAPVEWKEGRDWSYQELVEKASVECAPEQMNAEDPLFILYTSGSTGKPKGVLHTTAGYLLYASMTHQYVFDYRPGDVYWCTADVGWITGHSYITYGPLVNGATSVLFEGIPNYPDESRHWQIVDKYKVNIYYTAPTAIRSLMRKGDQPLQSTSRASLRVLGSVGEPINPEAWYWYFEKIGKQKCAVVDTWWQTETGGILISPIPGVTDLKPGSASLPFFGVKPALINSNGGIIEGSGEGALCIVDSWPGQMRTVYQNHDRFIETYFSQYPGKYFSGDGCRRDEDGFYWITGRLDDVINVSGHRLGTAEVESALVAHPSVSEAAVVGCPHEVKGQGIYSYVTLVEGVESSDDLKKELIQWVRKEIGPIATPDYIQWAPALPKTRSGKIMRRILRKIAEGQYSELGDTSTLADPAVVENLIDNCLYRPR